MACGVGIAKKASGGFEGWQTAGLKAKKKLLMGFCALACGVGAAKKASGGCEGWQTAGLNAKIIGADNPTCYQLL